MNAQNFGIATGRLTRDVTKFTNGDGSVKVMLTVATPNNFKNKDGKRDSQFIALEGLVNKNHVGANGEIGVYDFIKKGSLVSVQYTVRTTPYTDKKTGETVYPQTLFIENVSLLESKAVTDARGNNNAATQPQQAPTPESAPAAEDAPFK